MAYGRASLVRSHMMASAGPLPGLLTPSRIATTMPCNDLLPRVRHYERLTTLSFPPPHRISGRPGRHWRPASPAFMDAGISTAGNPANHLSDRRRWFTGAGVGWQWRALGQRLDREPRHKSGLLRRRTRRGAATHLAVSYTHLRAHETDSYL